jgi:dTDP-4-amino-4,6-dideoxygalactose transaminase
VSPTQGRKAPTSETIVPLFAHDSALKPLLPDVAARQRAVLESGRYILGPEVEAFESEFAAYLGRRHCVGVANGTEALTIALRSLGINPGDEVIVPAFTFFATAEAVVNAGAVPVLCDIDPLTHCMTAAQAEPLIGTRTRALLPVHLFGNPAPMGELTELAASRGVRLLADAAQAAGARIDGRMAGGAGDAATFSFYPGKNLGAFGDGGAIVTDDDEIADTARRLRNHGSERKWEYSEVGYNSRLDELQAAALRILLPHLDHWTEARRRVADIYVEAGLGDLVELPLETPGAESAFHLYVVMTPHRDQTAERLRQAGVEARAYYTPALHRQPALAPYAKNGRFPNAERVAAEGLALPMGPSLHGKAALRVVQAVRALAPDGSDRAP